MTTASQEAGQDEARREEAPLDELAPDERLLRQRHSAAHVLAEAVLELFPDAKYAIARRSSTASTTTSICPARSRPTTSQ